MNYFSIRYDFSAITKMYCPIIEAVSRSVNPFKSLPRGAAAKPKVKVKMNLLEYRLRIFSNLRFFWIFAIMQALL